MQSNAKNFNVKSPMITIEHNEGDLLEPMHAESGVAVHSNQLASRFYCQSLRSAIHLLNYEPFLVRKSHH